MADMAEIWYVTIQLFLSFFNFGSLPLFTISLTYSEVFFDAGSDAAKIKVIRRVVLRNLRKPVVRDRFSGAADGAGLR